MKGHAPKNARSRFLVPHITVYLYIHMQSIPNENMRYGHIWYIVTCQ